MSIITNQTSVFHDPSSASSSSATVHNATSEKQQHIEIKAATTPQYDPASSYSVGEIPKESYHRVKIDSISKAETSTERQTKVQSFGVERYGKEEEICESIDKDNGRNESYMYQEDESVGETKSKDERKCESFDRNQEVCEKDYKDNDKCESNYKDGFVCDSFHLNVSFCKNESIFEAKAKANTNKDLEKHEPNCSQPSNQILCSSHTETETVTNPQSPCSKNGTELLEDESSPNVTNVSLEASCVALRQVTETPLISKDIRDISNLDNDLNPCSSSDKTSINIEDLTTNKLDIDLDSSKDLDSDDSSIAELSSSEKSDLTLMISNQREKILKLRREERSSFENVTNKKCMQFNEDRKMNNLDNENGLDPGRIHKMSQELKSDLQELEKSKLKKKVKMQTFEGGGFDDIFGEQLNVKEFDSDVPMKRERKIPSKFIYLSKMEKYLSQSPTSKHKKKYKSKHWQSGELDNRIKVKSEEKSKQEIGIQDCKDIDKIKKVTKEENTRDIKLKISMNKNKDLHHSFSGNNSLSKSSSVSPLAPKSSEKSPLLRDRKFHQHCLRRHYRLRSSNWNCSSRRALRLLKRKYNSVNFLFKREPIICLKRLRFNDIETYLGRMRDSEVKCEAIAGKNDKHRPMQSDVRVPEKFEHDKKDFNSVFNARNEIKVETGHLVDPRVMSLSRTLQSANNGKVGLEKIFKSHTNKPVKNKRKENSKSPTVKKRLKPDWSKWKEKLKEASNRMVEKKKDEPVREKNVNIFPSDFVKTSLPSILHFRIPRICNKKEKTENKDTPEECRKENAAGTVKDTDKVLLDAPQSECSEQPKNKSIVAEDKNEFEVLKEVNEVLTLEEFESDNCVTYSINGYSIEISRDSPLDEKMNTDAVSSKNICFDEVEMNKILYGDSMDSVNLGIEENYGQPNTGLTVTSDIIPNLFAQNDVTFDKNSDFSDEVDKSPPVLVKSTLSTENSDFESEDVHRVHENEEQSSHWYEELEEQMSSTDVSEDEDIYAIFKEGMKEDAAKDEITLSKTNDEFKVDYSSDDSDWDFSHDKSLPPDSMVSGDLVKKDDIQTSSDTDDTEVGSGNYPNLSPKSVCSSSKTQTDADKCQSEENCWSSPEAEPEMVDIENETDNCLNVNNGLSKVKNEFKVYEDVYENVKLDNLVNVPTSVKLDNERNKLDGERFESEFESGIGTFTKEKVSSAFKLDDKIFRINKTKELMKTNKNERFEKAGHDLSSSKEFDRICYKNVVGDDKSLDPNVNFNDEKYECKVKEKSAASVMEDLENMWKQMISTPDKVENVSSQNAVDTVDNDEDVNYTREQVSHDTARMEMYAEERQFTFETVKEITNEQNEEDEGITGYETEDINEAVICDNERESIVTETKGHDKSDTKGNLNSDTSIKSNHLNDRNETKEMPPLLAADSYSVSKDVDFGFLDTREEKDFSENVEETGRKYEKKLQSEVVAERSSAESQSKEASSAIGDRKVEEGRQKKRKISNDTTFSCEKVQPSSDDNMEQSEERIMCDFPNHNWLFNKYNISEVRVEKDTEKEVKAKKQRKDEKDAMKKSDEAKSRRKSSSSTANILPTQRKLSTSKIDNVQESKHFPTLDKNMKGGISPDHKSIKIKWNKVKKRNSLSDRIVLDENSDTVTRKSGDVSFGNKIVSSKHSSQFDRNATVMTNLQETREKIDSSKHSSQFDRNATVITNLQETREKVGNYSPLIKNEHHEGAFKKVFAGDTFGPAAKHNLNKTKLENTNIDHLKKVNDNKYLNSNAVYDINFKMAQKGEISADNTNVSRGVCKEPESLDRTSTNIRVRAEIHVEDPGKSGKNLLGNVINDENEDDEDDDIKLEIDESAYTEEIPNVKKLPKINVQQPDLDEQTSTFETFEPRTNSSVVESTSDTADAETDDIARSTAEDGSEFGFKVEPSATSTAIAAKTESGLASEITSLKSDTKATDVATVRTSLSNRFETGPLEVCPIKSEASGITFRQRTKPPVQLVHPQVFKPPTVKLKVESSVTSEIQTHVSVHVVETKEESVAVAGTADDTSFPSQTVSKVDVRPGLTQAQNSSDLDTCLTSPATSLLSTTLLSLSTPHVPALSTLAQISGGCTTLTTASPSSFGNGMVVPIQPFVQNVPDSQQQAYVQSIPQLQPNLVQIQSQNIDPVFQQSSPVQIQNQLIPVSIYQSGNQTLISNYSFPNSSSEQMVSGQSANIIEAQPVNFNMNQTQLSASTVRKPLCRPVNSGPPPLFILPKPTNMSSLNQQFNQSPFLQTKKLSCKSQKHKNFSAKKKENEISTNKNSYFSVSDSIQTQSSDSGKEKKHSEISENTEEEVDDEIKKEMEELDREIKRKEQEQEEMRRKKLELLEKMKQSKAVSKVKEVESETNSKIENSDRTNDVEVTKEGTEPTVSLSEIVVTEKLSSETEKVHKEKKSSSKDVVLSEVIEEPNDDVFDSDTPIDLSSALRSSDIDNFSNENLSLTVSDGVLSIKETNSSIESSGFRETVRNLDIEKEKSESELDGVDEDDDDDESVMRENYQNKCDGINYIEDIGLVNPFTGEYEINEDVEGVEYLDLSTKLDEGSNENDPCDLKGSVYRREKKSNASKNLNEIDMDDNDLKQTEQSEETEKLEEESNNEVCSKSSKGGRTKEQLPISLCITKPVSTESDSLHEPLVNSLSTSMTVVSALSSHVSTISYSGTYESSKPELVPPAVTANSLLLAKPCDISVSYSMSGPMNNSYDSDNAPLNLEKVKPKPSPGNKSVPSESVLNRESCKSSKENDLSPLRTTTSMNISQSEKVYRIGEATDCEPKTVNRNQKGFPSSSFPENEQQVVRSKVQSSDAIVETSIPQIQLSSPSLTVESRHLTGQSGLHQDQQGLVQAHEGASQTVQSDKQFKSKHSQRINTDFPSSRGRLHRRRERYVELKPAHYRSPPRKIQKGLKPLPAHNQKPTSRDAMKKMCKSPFIPPYIVQRTSPFICRKYPVTLSPKEVEKTFPRLWEKRPPKPAHSKRPFGIAGHLIVQTSRKFRKRAVSGELVSPPQFNSLPNTPTSSAQTPPRATSVDFHGSYSPLHSPVELRGPSNTAATSASPQKSSDNQVGLPSPIRAHCRPRSMMAGNRFYETSVLKPPALHRNSKVQSELPVNDAVEVIDLTADVHPPVRLDPVPKPLESSTSKERKIQKELSRAVSKRQRMENVETSPTERTNKSNQNEATRLQQQQQQQQLLGQINARQRLMPPPPYTGRQRMPVLVQVPRQQLFEQQPRMQYDRRIEPQFNDNRKFNAQNMTQPDMQRFQKPQEMMQVNDPQIRPQMWPNQFVGHAQEIRPFGARPAQPGMHAQDVRSGNEQFIPNQDMNIYRGAPGQMYQPRGPAQTAGCGMTGYGGNPRMQHPNISSINNIPQQGYPIRSQNMPFTTTQNQTQIHQLLQQPHANSQMIMRGNPNPQMMQRGEISPQMMQRGQISPQMMQGVETSPQVMQRPDMSPQVMQRQDMSPQVMQRPDMNPQVMQRPDMSPQVMQRPDMSPQVMQRPDMNPQAQRQDMSPQVMQRRERSPQIMQRREANTQVMQRGNTSPQIILNGSVSPHMMQRPVSSQMMQISNSNLPVMQAPNIQMMPTGEMNPKVLYSTGNGQPMMHASESNQVVISPTGILGQAQMAQKMSPPTGYPRMQMPSNNQMQGPPAGLQPALSPEQRFQRMQMIRAQHIRSQQFQGRGPNNGFEQGTRMPHSGMDPGINTSSQQLAAFNTGIPNQSIGPKGQHVQSNNPPQMAVLDQHMDRGIHPHPGQRGLEHPHPGQQGLEPGNKGPPYPAPGSQVQPMMSPIAQQSPHFQQNEIHNNMNTVQQSNQIQRPVYIVQQNSQVPQPIVVVNTSQHMQNSQGQIVTQSPSGMVAKSQGRQVQGQGQITDNVTIAPGSQMGQGSFSHQNNLQNNSVQIQNQNWHGNVQGSAQIQGSNSAKKRQSRSTRQASIQPNAEPNVENCDMVYGIQQPNITSYPQTTVTMTTNKITQNSITRDQAANQIQQSATNNAQITPSRSQGQSEGHEESKVTDEDLPHLQQVHGECVMCGKYSLYLCSNCKKIWYCSPECQLTHWQTHADECEGQTE